MSACSRCGALFDCAMADGAAAPCWCMALAPVVAVPVPGQLASCWCPACLRDHLAALETARPPDHT